MSTVVFLTGQSMNDALASLGRAHKSVFEELGYDFIAVNFSEPDATQVFNQVIQSGQIEFAYSAMGGGAEFAIGEAGATQRNMWQALGVPFLSVMGDTPAYFFDRHVMETAWHACLYCYPEHLEFRRRLPTSPALYGVIPPSPIDTIDRRNIDFRRKAQGKLLFLKNGNDPDQLVRGWKAAFPTGTFLMLAELSSTLVANIKSGQPDDIDEFVVRSFSQKGWDIQEFRNLRLMFVAQLDDYVRRIKSSLIADVIADFPVEIYGFNWEHMDFSRRRAKFVPGGDYTQSRELISNSLGLIDMSPNTQRAPHDRPMRAFGLYTLCLTNSQRFFTDSYKHADAFSFDFDRESIAELVARVLANPKQYVEIGEETAQQFRDNHRSTDFAQYMLDAASHVRSACGARSKELQNYFIWPPSKGAHYW